MVTNIAVTLVLLRTTRSRHQVSDVGDLLPPLRHQPGHHRGILGVKEVCTAQLLTRTKELMETLVKTVNPDHFPLLTWFLVNDFSAEIPALPVTANTTQSEGLEMEGEEHVKEQEEKAQEEEKEKEDRAT